jgi:crotonobetainyl-CoA:carnitine CoA-transferase CaiB-like acyl-CoA transferase
VAINIYPRLHTDALKFLRCSDSPESVNNAVLQWRAAELEAAAQEAGLPFCMVRTNEEFLQEPQYTEVLSTMPLITLEKIGESEPIPFTRGAKSPLEGIRALGLGHVIAGAAIGRDLAYYGADVLNVWRPNDAEIDALLGTCRLGCAPRCWTALKKTAQNSSTL